jgi:predicted PurR-regulated permease PerM
MPVRRTEPVRPSETAIEPAAATSMPAGARWRGRASVVTAVLVSIGALYIARPVLVPLAIAVLVAFVLGPILGPLERRLGRPVAVTLLVVALLGVLGALAWGVGRQVNDLAGELPQHRERLRQRIAELRRTTGPTPVAQLPGLVDELIGGLSGSEPGTREPPMVVVQQARADSMLSPVVVIRSAITAALTLLLALFFLLERQELRNRLIRLAGFARLPIATRALDEASRRIATYLVSQLAVNTAFGCVAAIGLLVIGVPYALLWGLTATLLRFVPFVGFWASLGVAVAASLTVSTGWTTPALVIGLYGGLGLVLMAGVEPHLYSRNAGVSRVALLTAVMAFGWLWGPAGLLLATPLTVCLVVLGRHLPELKAIALVLGDTPALAPHMIYYQRLLAGDRDEAAELVEAFLVAHSPERLFDAVVVPALSALRADRSRGGISDADQERIVRATRRILDEMLPPASADDTEGAGASIGEVGVIGVPADDAIDTLALSLFGRLCGADHLCRFTELSPDLLSSEVVEAVVRSRPKVVCIAAVPPGALAETRYLTKRLRARLPDVIVLVGRWGGDGYREAAAAALVAAGAHDVATTLAESRRHLAPLLQLAAPPSDSHDTPRAARRRKRHFTPRSR